MFVFILLFVFFSIFVVPNLAGLIVSDLVPKNRKSPATAAPRGQGEAGATSRCPPFGSYHEPSRTNGATVALALHPARAANQSQVQEPGHGRPGRSERPRPPFGFVLKAAAMEHRAQGRISIARARRKWWQQHPSCACRSLCPARIGLDKSERALEPFRVASPRPHARTLAGSRKG